MIEKIFYYNPSNLTRRIVFIFFDIISFAISFYLSFIFKAEQAFNFDNKAFLLLTIFIVVKLIIFSFFSLYDVSWKYVSLADLAKILKASVLSSIMLFCIVYGFGIKQFSDFPKSILLIDLMFTVVLTSSFKISKRMYLEVMRQTVNNSGLKRTLIIGAGSSGEQIIRDINRSLPRKFYLIGLIDDDERKKNLFLQGVKVLGSTSDLKDIIKKYNIETILISVLSANKNFNRRIVNIARDAGIKDIKILSTFNDISNTIKVKVQDIKDVDVYDLIGRQAITINTRDISKYTKNKRVLITGAAGSIGSEISRQVIAYQPSLIAILDNNESDLADLEIQLQRKFDHSKIKMYLCDISNSNKVDKIIENFRPEVIFHAAAYKHVPVMEKFPEEAVKVNIFGTYYLTKAALKFGVENFVLISTDKAVNPTSIMGASKRIAEYIVTTAGHNNNSNFVAVRFGNVIGSRGSVLPIFLDQIKAGGPITVTHPDMQRYFMTIPEAVALVLQAAATGSSGDVFVLDMGDPIKILDIVNDLILLNNMVPDKDIKIIFTGIREGEKLFEEVLTAEEGVINTNHPKIYKAKMTVKHSIPFIEEMLNEFEQLSVNTTKEEWLASFKYYIPTFAGKVIIDKEESQKINEVIKRINK